MLPMMTTMTNNLEQWLSMRRTMISDKETLMISEQEVIGKMNLVFKHPFTRIIASPTSSGKTVFTNWLIKNI